MPKRLRYGARRFRKRFTRRSMLRRRRRPRAFRKAVRKVLFSTMETKRRYSSLSFGAMNHNVLHSVALFNNVSANALIPPQGDGQNQRTGREIYTRYLQYRGSFSIPFDRRNTALKFWAIECNTNYGTPTNYATFFESNTGNGMIDPVNPKWKAKFLGTYRVKARDLYVERGDITDAGADATIYVNFKIPFKRHLVFGDDSTGARPVQSGMKEFFEIICLPYDTITTLETDTVVTAAQGCATVYYKDP